jgi:glutathione S-transferase
MSGGTPALRLWGRLSSVNVQKVAWTLGEVQLPHERIDVGGRFGGVDTSAFLAMNPMAQVPVLQDGDFVLWESNAIVRYLCARYAHGTLYPAPLHARADADRWMDWQTTELSRAMGPAFMQLVRTPAERRDRAAIDASLARTEPLLAILDAQLADRAYVCADRITMADLVLGCAAHRWFGLPLDQGLTRQPRPAVERWYQQLRARPAAQSVLTLPLQ